jgi:dipeptidyl aminopeptidase/acylaminoacyl peptidase
MAQPFDVNQLQLTGKSFPIVEQQVSYNVQTGGLWTFSASENVVLFHQSGGNKLVCFDRKGRLLRLVGEDTYYSSWLLSDGQRTVAERFDPQSGASDIWLLDFSRDTTTRLTFHVAEDGFPIGSPEGNRIIFTSNRDGRYNLYQKDVSGAGQEELLLRSDTDKFPTDWSRDGQFIIYEDSDTKADDLYRRRDLWILPLFGDRKPSPFLQTEFKEHQASFSPDGKRIAYVSNESGKDEVYIRNFSGAGSKLQISNGGGYQPRWRQDGKELFYISPNQKFMAVEVDRGSGFKAGVPEVLFDIPVVGLSIPTRYGVAQDGQQFILVSSLEESNLKPLTVVLNWAAGRKQRITRGL